MKRTFAVLLLTTAIGAFAWLAAYFFRGSEASAERPLPARLSLQDISTTYEEQVEPILRANCGQCHSDTRVRPLLSSVPVLGSAYVESEIRNGRLRFDISAGLPTDRIGAVLEFVRSLRRSISEDTMPPWAYVATHPQSVLRDGERSRLLAWAELASDTLLRADPRAIEGRLGVEQLTTLANALVDACPLAPPDDLGAQASCAERIAQIDLLREHTNDPMWWGQQTHPDHVGFAGLVATRFSPRVWRVLYGSLFMYGPGFDVSSTPDGHVLRMPVRFRGELEVGEYPYPFWHSEEKWEEYVRAAELLFVARRGRIVGVLRGHERRDAGPSRRDWNGRWQWTSANGSPAPAAAMLFSRLLSPDNPFVDELDRHYRELAVALREADCLSCHSPDNRGDMTLLELFAYPNHALTARNRLVATLELDAMPPIDGIPDSSTRQNLLDLAIRFRDTANRALAHDEPSVADWLAGPLGEPGP